MKRRSRAGGEATKGRRRKTPEPKRRNAPKAEARSNSTSAGTETEVARLTRELSEAREQRRATSDVLQVISSFAGELEPVFQTILANATRPCEAKFANLLLYEGGPFRVASLYGAPRAWAALRRREPIVRPGRKDDPLCRVAATKQLQHVADIRTEKSYIEHDPPIVAMADMTGGRTVLLVPMLKENELVGIIAIYRQEVRPFTDKQIELVENFAAQAVIAIENARLLNELRHRTADLTEALDQQTATSELLQVISSSPGDLEPIFATMLENAVRICDATFGDIFRWEDGTLRLVTSHETPAAFAEMLRRSPVIRPGHSSFTRLMLETKTRAHIVDLSADPMYLERKSAQIGAAVDLGGVRTVLAVPMFREGELIGEFILNRQEVRPFTEKQIELVENFAAQAVIAIENARLLNELRQRTTDLTEALEQQTATSDILHVISSFPGDLEPVFATMLEKAVRICDASFGQLYRWNGEAFSLLATHNTPPTFLEYRRGSPHFVPDPGSAFGRIVATKTVVHVVDATSLESYVERSNPALVAAVELAGIRTFLFVPMLKEDELLGIFTIFRQEVRPFADKQIALVTNFAAQAVIAIENARLLDELRELNQGLEERVADQLGEIERMSRLRRFLPPQVADLIVASGTEKQLESHRREITALFCDLRGFTGFTEAADAEDVMALLRDYHAAIGEIIIKYNGTLERYAGDGVMVVFNDPVPVENPALQAVLMALDAGRHRNTY